MSIQMLEDVQILDNQISTIKLIQGHRTSTEACLVLVNLQGNLTTYYTLKSYFGNLSNCTRE